jgi:hypothetical protein
MVMAKARQTRGSLALVGGWRLIPLGTQNNHYVNLENWQSIEWASDNRSSTVFPN